MSLCMTTTWFIWSIRVLGLGCIGVCIRCVSYIKFDNDYFEELYIRMPVDLLSIGELDLDI